MITQGTAIVASVSALAMGLIFPDSVAWLLVVAALAAAFYCTFAAQRLTPEHAGPWYLLSLGQLLNGLGNMVIAFNTKQWVDAPDWVSATVFNSATIATVVGIVGLCVGASAREVFCAVLDLIVISGCALGLAVMWNLGRFFGHPAADASTLLDLMGFLAVVVGFVGAGFGLVAWRVAPDGLRTAYRLAVLGHIAATLGDTEVLGDYLGIKFEIVSLTWVASSLFILVAAAFLRRNSAPSNRIRAKTLPIVALGLVGVQLIALAIWPVPYEVGVVIAVAIAVAALRQLIWAAERQAAEASVS